MQTDVVGPPAVHCSHGHADHEGVDDLEVVGTGHDEKRPPASLLPLTRPPLKAMADEVTPSDVGRRSPRGPS